MSGLKERIFGAVTVMSEKDAAALWNMILENFAAWENIETVSPDETDLAMLSEIKNNPECSMFVSSENMMKELGL